MKIISPQSSSWKKTTFKTPLEVLTLYPAAMNSTREKYVNGMSNLVSHDSAMRQIFESLEEEEREVSELSHELTEARTALLWEKSLFGPNGIKS